MSCDLYDFPTGFLKFMEIGFDLKPHPIRYSWHKSLLGHSWQFHISIFKQNKLTLVVSNISWWQVDKSNVCEWECEWAQLSVDSILHGVLCFPDFHCAVTIKEITKKTVINTQKYETEAENTTSMKRLTQVKTLCDLLWGCEQMGTVSCQAVDGAVVSLDLSKGCQWVGVPKAKQPSSAPTEEHRGTRYDAQSTNPVCLGTDRLLGDDTTNC